MDLTIHFVMIFGLMVATNACNSFKLAPLHGCETDRTPLSPSHLSSSVSSAVECLFLCHSSQCDGFSVCPDASNVGPFSCDLFISGTDGTCASLGQASGCRYMEVVQKCVPPRLYDYGRGQCACDPVWMKGPNCDQYYKDCTEAYAEGLTGSVDDYLAMAIQPVVSALPIEVKCFLDFGGYAVMQDRTMGCPDDLTGLGWSDFRDGVGNFSCSFHLGLENVFQILQNGEFQLDVRVEGEDSLEGSAYYRNFRLSAEDTDYIIDWDNYISDHATAEDGLDFGGPYYLVKGCRFATYDNDFNGCADAQGTGWWFNHNCAYVNLNLALNTPAAAGVDGFASWPKNGVLKMVNRVLLRLKRTSDLA